MKNKERDTRRDFLKKASLGFGAGVVGTCGVDGYARDDSHRNEEMQVSGRRLKNARIILETSCRAKEGESVLILADEKLLPYAPALVTASLN